MKRKKLATMLVVAFAISATSVAPVMGAENEDISKYDCDYKPWLEMNAGVSDVFASAWASETTFEPYWTTTSVNVRTKPNTDSEIVTTLLWNQQVSVASFDNEWDLIYWNDNIYYINKDYLQDHEAEFEMFEVPYASHKTWMPYTAITNRKSPQYKLQQTAYTGKYGMRMVGDRYCVALGSYFGCEIGDEFDLVLANGTVIPCIMSDEKADIHTDSRNIITKETDCLSEFVVDKSALDINAKRAGDMSSVCQEWDSPVTQIRVYKNKEEK